jgi:hypothetical protein
MSTVTANCLQITTCELKSSQHKKQRGHTWLTKQKAELLQKYLQIPRAGNFRTADNKVATMKKLKTSQTSKEDKVRTE